MGYQRLGHQHGPVLKRSNPRRDEVDTKGRKSKPNEKKKKKGWTLQEESPSFMSRKGWTLKEESLESQKVQKARENGLDKSFHKKTSEI